MMISFKDELLNPTWALRISFQKEIFQVKPNRDSPSTLSSDSSKGPGTERQFLTTPSPQPYPITTLKGLEGGPLILRGGPHDVPWRHLRFRISGSQENQDIVYPAELCLFCCLVALGCFICSCCSCFFPSYSYFFLLSLIKRSLRNTHFLQSIPHPNSQCSTLSRTGSLLLRRMRTSGMLAMWNSSSPTALPVLP